MGTLLSKHISFWVRKRWRKGDWGERRPPARSAPHHAAAGEGHTNDGCGASQQRPPLVVNVVNLFQLRLGLCSLPHCFRGLISAPLFALSSLLTLHGCSHWQPEPLPTRKRQHVQPQLHVPHHLRTTVMHKKHRAHRGAEGGREDSVAFGAPDTSGAVACNLRELLPLPCRVESFQ